MGILRSFGLLERETVWFFSIKYVWCCVADGFLPYSKRFMWTPAMRLHRGNLFVKMIDIAKIIYGIAGVIAKERLVKCCGNIKFFTFDWLVDRLDARVNLTLCGRKCVRIDVLYLVRFGRIRCDKYKCYFCDWIRSHIRLGIIATFEIIILYLISHVYHVHTAAETSPSPALATEQHSQSAKCWKLESTYL